MKKPASRFAFPGTRVRIGVDRFEISFRQRPSPFALLFLCLPLLPFIPVMIAVECLRRLTLVVTRNEAWVDWSVLGIRYRRRWVGVAPAIDTSGWDWSEFSAVPAEAALRADLGHAQRVVFAEWAWDDAEKDAEADRLVRLTRHEISRLLAPRLLLR